MSKTITRVVLYRHGMGCFEHRLDINDSAEVELMLRLEAISGALKSLTVDTEEGGRLVSVACEPHPSTTANAREGINGEPSGLVGLMGQLRGAEVSIEIGDAEVRGHLVGIERVQEVVSGAVIESEVAGILSDGQLRRVPLRDISSIRPLEFGLRRALESSLARSARALRPDCRKLTLKLEGDGAWQARVRYTAASAGWKTSYRVLFEGDAPPILLAYALIDNMTLDDWENVEMTLVSGRPLALSDEIAPVGRVSSDAGPPGVIEGATFEASEAPASSPAMRVAGDRPTVAPMPPKSRVGVRMRHDGPAQRQRTRRPTTEDFSQALVESARPSSTLEEQAFRFDAPHKVSIPSGQSALVPILRQAIEGEVVAVYNESIRSGNPLTAFFIRNTTGHAFERGPTTAFWDGEYAGETLLDGMAPGETRLLPFAVELRCRVDARFSSDAEAEQSISAGRGYLFHTRWTRSATTYTIVNETGRPLKLYIDHPADRHAEYIDDCEPVEQTESFDRFEVMAAVGENTVRVAQKRRNTETLWVTPDQIREQIQLVRTIGNDGLMGELLPLLEISDMITEFRLERARADEEIAKITKQHSRIRKNLEALGQDNDKERELRERYIGALSEDETRLQELQRHRHDTDRNVQLNKKRFKEQAGKLLGG